MEGIGYILVYFLKGDLPWQGIKAQTKHEKQQMIMEKKMGMTSELLCNGLPHEFQNYLQMVMDLGFEEKPNYDFYRQQFSILFRKLGFDKTKDKDEPMFDWVMYKKVLLSYHIYYTFHSFTKLIIIFIGKKREKERCLINSK